MIQTYQPYHGKKRGCVTKLLMKTSYKYINHCNRFISQFPIVQMYIHTLLPQQGVSVLEAHPPIFLARFGGHDCGCWKLLPAS